MAVNVYVGLGVSGVLAIVGALLVIYGRKERALRAIMQSTPVTPIAQLTSGQYTALEGKATQTQTPLIAPYTDIPCLCYSYHVEELVREMRDGREQEEWRTVDRQSGQTPFVLTDATGGIEVNVDGAKFDMISVLAGPIPETSAATAGTLGKVADVAVGIAMATGLARRMRVNVSAIPLNSPLYMLGDIQQDASGHPRVAKGQKPLFISARSEQAAVRSAGVWSWVCLILGFALIAGGISFACYSLMGKFLVHR